MLEIEIVESNIIDGGVEVFARAWQDGIQIGFGTDGTVDIERFRIFNPPVLVLDPNGAIVEIVPEETLENGIVIPERTVAYREDPEEAILQALEHTIATMQNKHGDTVIIANKRGNTTSTFYSGTGGDGSITSYNATWATARSGSSLSANSTGTQANVYLDYPAVGGYNIRHLFFPFNTSSIPDTDSISAATFSTCHVGTNEQDNDSLSIGVLASTQTSASSLTTSHFVPASYATEYAARKTIASINAQTNNTYTDWTLTDTSIVSKTGVTPLMLVIDRVIDDISTGGSSTNYTDFYMANETGTSKDPKLVVEHAAASTFIPKVIMY